MTPTIMIALDFPTGQKALEFLDRFQEPVFVKVGMELYYSEGPSIIEEIKKRGHRIFLDLKLHDIPNTVKSAMKVLARLGVDMTNVHAAGGIKMMQAAAGISCLQIATQPFHLIVDVMLKFTQFILFGQQIIEMFELKF